MNEIEKLYENAGIKPIKQGYCDWDCDCPYPDIINNGCGDECPYWKYEDEANYPSFTAEKQLELIKWSARREPKVEIGYSSVYGYWVENQTDTRYYFGDQFDNALASLINILWQDLTVEERKQIRDILAR